VSLHRDRAYRDYGRSLDGYLGSFVRFPEAKLSFIALANSDDGGGVPAFGGQLRAFVDLTLAGGSIPISRRGPRPTAYLPADRPTHAGRGAALQLTTRAVRKHKDLQLRKLVAGEPVGASPKGWDHC